MVFVLEFIMTGSTMTDYSPYDPIPRIIASDEYDELERGLKQRVNALNAFLRDIYSDKNIIHDGVIPEEFVYTSPGYLPQVNGVTPPGGVLLILQAKI